MAKGVYKMKKTKCGNYGIKAYGRWFCFDGEEAFKAYLMDWICDTEGAERDRACEALRNLLKYVINFTDTDI